MLEFVLLSVHLLDHIPATGAATPGQGDTGLMCRENKQTNRQATDVQTDGNIAGSIVLILLGEKSKLRTRF